MKERGASLVIVAMIVILLGTIWFLHAEILNVKKVLSVTAKSLENEWVLLYDKDSGRFRIDEVDLSMVWEMLSKQSSFKKKKKVEVKKVSKAKQKTRKRQRLDWAPGWSNPGGDPLGYNANTDKAIRDLRLPEFVKEAFIVMVQEADLAKNKPIHERLDLELYMIRNGLRIEQMHSKRAVDGTARIMERFTVAFENKNRKEKAYRWRIDYEGVMYYLLVPHACFNVSWYKEPLRLKKKKKEKLLVLLPPPTVKKRALSGPSFKSLRKSKFDTFSEFDSTVFAGGSDGYQKRSADSRYWGTENNFYFLKYGNLKLGVSHKIVEWKGKSTGSIFWGNNITQGLALKYEPSKRRDFRLEIRRGIKRGLSEAAEGLYQAGFMKKIWNIEGLYRMRDNKCKVWFCRSEIGFMFDLDTKEGESWATWKGKTLPNANDFDRSAYRLKYEIDVVRKNGNIYALGSHWVYTAENKRHAFEYRFITKFWNENAQFYLGHKILEGSINDAFTWGVSLQLDDIAKQELRRAKRRKWEEKKRRKKEELKKKK